jgi:hypothetical protein
MTKECYIVCMVILLTTFSCKMHNIAGKYMPNNTKSIDIMLSETLILKKNHRFHYSRIWDLGRFVAKGSWKIQDSILVLQSEKSVEDCLTVIEIENSNKVQDSTQIEIRVKNYPLSFATVKVITQVDSYVFETNSDGKITILLPDYCALSIDHSPAIVANPIEYTIKGRRLRKIELVLSEDCVGKPFFRIPFLYKKDSLNPMTINSSIIFNKLYKHKK